MAGVDVSEKPADYLELGPNCPPEEYPCPDNDCPYRDETCTVAPEEAK